jgi:hypothetical protein
MPQVTTGEERKTAAQQEHAALLPLLDEAERARTGPELAALQARLRAWVPAHFAGEEAPGGLLDEALRRAPHRARELEALVDEHHALTAALAQLDSDPERVEHMAALCVALREHERREAALLASLSYAETGTGD